MSAAPRARAAAALAALALAAAAVSGCGTLLGGDVPASTYFVWSDPGRSAPAAQPAPRSLLLAPTTTVAFSDTQRIVFSRAPGTRAYYQLAEWTERPGNRFDVLLLKRLEQRNAFAQVSLLTSATRGDLMLAATILDIYHDDARPPGLARLQISVELSDRNARRLLARRTFVQEVAVREANAADAVGAFNTAVGALLDELLPWLEAEAAKAATR